MTDSKPAARRAIKLRSREKPERNRAWRFIFITLGAGALAAVIATLIAALPTAGSVIFRPAPQTIKASALFPAPPPVHKVVNVNDPPPKQAPMPPAAAPPPEPTEPPAKPSPTPSPRPQPSPPPNE
jgi:outer membrane biosynthesis protein TonB